MRGSTSSIDRRHLTRRRPAEAYRVVSPNYFSTMGIQLVRGRFPTPDDRADRAPALVVNQALAKKYWPNEDPIGKQIRLGAPGNYLNAAVADRGHRR